MYRLGIDIGGTKVKIGIYSPDKKLLSSEKIYVKQINDNNFFEQVATAAVDVIHKNGFTINDFEFCGIGVPGTTDKTGKIAYKLPNLGIYNEPAAQTAESILKIPTRLVQDSRAAAWGEYITGAGRGYKSVVCITIGTGIGTGIIQDGKIFDGANGTAGEMGHYIVDENGRACRCGKSGCLGMYSAGLGLEISAKELFGENADAKTLFDKAKEGSTPALEKLNQAVLYLGKEIVSLYNNISPDCILFSGGIAKQKELYTEPLIDYIKKNIYTAGKEPYIGVAELGEDAPLAGAALLPYNGSRPVKLSASIMCGDIMNMQKDFDLLKDAEIELFHMDVMDGHFVPNLMMPPEYINTMRKHTDIPFDIHIMAENPERIIPSMNIGEGDIISVHYESTPHIQRALAMIKEKGAKASIALNPSTPIECVSELLDDVDMVLVMTVNPGFAGQKLIPHGLDKIAKMREYLDINGHSDIDIEVDGNCSFENIPKMYKAGANIFVLGTSGLFRKDISIKAAAEKVRRSLEDIK